MIKSLRGRLFFGLTAIIVFTGTIGSGLAYKWAYSEAIEMQDSVLMQIGTFAMTAPLGKSQSVRGVDSDSEIAIVELGSAATGDPDDRRFWELQDGLQNEIYAGEQVRVLVRTRSDGSRFAIIQQTEIRSELAGNMALRTLVPIGALVPCLMLVTALVISRSFVPMIHLADELNARRGDDLQHIAASGAPSELHPFLTAIDGLMARMATMMDRQRRFIADAAHELRTPITALGLQAENIDLADIPERARDRVVSLKNGMTRTKRLLEQLLTLARQDEQQTITLEIVSLDAMTKGIVADFLPNAAARDIDLGFRLAEQVSIKAEPFSLMLAVRNLVENALKFTPNGGTIDVDVTQEGENAILRIEDNGPGVPAEDLPRLFEPFFRGNQPAGEGSGLGLSIAKRVIDHLQGSIKVENVSGTGRSGLKVTVAIPHSPAQGPARIDDTFKRA